MEARGRALLEGDLTGPAGTIVLGENLAVLRERVADESADLVYLDPPFNTGKTQARTRIRVERAEGDDAGDRVGFGGRSYRTVPMGTKSFADSRDDYVGFLEPRLRESRRVLAPHGTLYLHLDPREAHYVKILLDGIFGRESFLNEIVWAYDYGGRGKRRWPEKHDTILVYVKDPERYFFDADAIERIPYMAPGLVTPEKRARGKLPTDVWWHTIVPTNGKERTGYPTQKPLGILRRIVQASSKPGDLVLDFFAGSGTTGAAALELGRRFLLVDENPEALETMAKRFEGVPGIEWVGYEPLTHESRMHDPSTGIATASGGA